MSSVPSQCFAEEKPSGWPKPTGDGAPNKPDLVAIRLLVFNVWCLQERADLKSVVKALLS